GLPADGLQQAANGTWTAVPYTSPTNIAAYLWSVLSAEALGLIGPEESGARIGRTLAILGRMDRAQGFFYNWYDTGTASPLAAWPGDGPRLRPFLSSVDNAWLAAALMMVANARPDLAEPARALVRPMDFAFFFDAYDPAAPDAHPGLFRVGYWADTRTPTAAHYGLLNTEARIISYIGIVLGQIPPEHYYRLRRSMPADHVDQQQVPTGETQTLRGIAVFQGNYTYRGLRFVPSWGGSMFEALMVPLFVPEADWGPASWGVNHPAYARAQIEYGRQAGHGLWGFSPASRPAGGYREYGVPDLGTLRGGYPSGDVVGVEPGAVPGDVVTPHAAFLALPFAPREAQAVLEALADQFPTIYGRYGFADSVNVGSGQVAQAVLALDQGMILGALANTLVDRFLQRVFATGRVEAVLRPLMEPERFTAGSERPALAAAADPAPAAPKAEAGGLGSGGATAAAATATGMSP
ncbi:MAG TPA: glucoamylase family protein, partial [Isosphaeraceae bacterium]